MHPFLKRMHDLRYVLGVGIVGTIGCQLGISHMLKVEIFGEDGNGGHMLKMLTSLTDQEIASLKAFRRHQWHFPLMHTLKDNTDLITEQSLDKYNIKIDQEPYIEYQKRPPHDKYL